jgi:kynurenine aminotransferase
VTAANDWKLDFDELESKITPRSKVLIFNNPTNIPGKVPFIFMNNNVNK